MKRITLFLAVLFASLFANAQTTADGAAVMEPITKLFTGMNLGDSAMVHSAFVSSPNPMQTIARDKNGAPVLRSGDLKGFLKAVGTPHAETWSEPIWDAKVDIDGNMAQVWVKYAFYLGKKFSHCGVDAFQLFKGPDGKWRIFNLADTRQTEGCEVPAYIRDTFK
ncbi:MAG: hypothetical protein ACOYW3_16950 [Bacteroidota bacterium]